MLLFDNKRYKMVFKFSKTSSASWKRQFALTEKNKKKRLTTKKRQKEIDIRRFEAITGLIGNVFSSLIIAAVLSVMFYFVYKSIAVCAGETTVVSVDVRETMSRAIPYVLSILISGGGVIYGRKEKHLARKTAMERDELQERYKELQGKYQELKKMI